jgi:hypothetical protein
MKIKETRFFAADDIRAELDGKVTCVGLFAHDNIFLLETNKDRENPSKDKPWLTNIAILISSKVDEGEYKTSISIYSPDGTNVSEQGNNIVMKKNGVANLILKLNNLPVIEFGEWRLVFNFECTSEEYKFSIGRIDV